MGEGPIACLDVAYRTGVACAAGVLLRQWADEEPVAVWTAACRRFGAYKSGEFYLRELTPLLALLKKAPARPRCLVIDAYVWLDQARTAGLGGYLWEAQGKKTPVVGVAKNPFGRADFAVPVCRGRSKRPLYVTAAGIPPEEAARLVRAMAGPGRIPHALGLADRLAREALREGVPEGLP